MNCNYLVNSDKEELKSILTAFGLKQLIEDPTRATQNSIPLIDVITPTNRGIVEIQLLWLCLYVILCKCGTVTSRSKTQFNSCVGLGISLNYGKSMLTDAKPRDSGETNSIQLHMFADGSLVGNGVVAYLRLVDVFERIHCSFGLTKARLALAYEITIPRLELTSFKFIKGVRTYAA